MNLVFHLLLRRGLIHLSIVMDIGVFWIVMFFPFQPTCFVNYKFLVSIVLWERTLETMINVGNYTEINWSIFLKWNGQRNMIFKIFSEKYNLWKKDINDQRRNNKKSANKKCFCVQNWICVINWVNLRSIMIYPILLEGTNYLNSYYQTQTQIPKF